MLTQLDRLTTEADGRFATAAELKFLRDYLDTVNGRVETYQKIGAAADSIVSEIQQRQLSAKSSCYTFSGKDQASICRRDLTNAIRLSATAMLFADLDLLRDGFVLWYRTIVKSFNYSHMAENTYGKQLPDMMKKLLSPLEYTYMQPILSLNHSILSQ
ncbi:allophycocyanin [Thermosynechococcaceae cyanobacterium BACA0444]|uniref:Allophycocyanin n=1 Tax=Pseudocalidococcus azoricus BACA0444 TaxID=2918990 RepID=A0AAE4JX22_9CYAN|nr:allophycocyanin [Pseudocalidococcus azoricus]MDS3861686.1 allophycocyanin [Pseudocalidococcus azoricus BACA0444]